MIIKHFPSANKEWINSVYHYNKANSSSELAKHNKADKIIKGHFNLKYITARPRSKRMRVMLHRRKILKIFVSRPYIKQTSDKNTYTVFVYDKYKQYAIRKLFFFRKKYNFYKLWLLNNFNLKKNLLKSNNSYLLTDMNLYFGNIKYSKTRLWINRSFYKFNTKKVTKKKINKKITKQQLRKIRYKYSSLVLRNELNLIKHKLNSSYQNYNLVKNIILYKFLLTMISMVNNNKSVLLDKLNHKLLITNIINNNKIDLARLHIFNKSLLYYVKLNILDNKLLNIEQIKSLYQGFRDKYADRLLIRLQAKHMKTIKNLSHIELTNSKYNKLLHNLKVFLGRLYSKSVNINIINLKYPFLDANIYAQLITHKARKKLSFLKVIAGSIKLAKLCNMFNPLSKITVNNYSNLVSYSKTKLKKYKIKTKDYLNNIMLNLFTKNLSNKQLNLKNSKYILNKTNTILNQVKFKWISGIRIEGRGRLTRRFTAARSIYKYKYLGNLRNKQYQGDAYNLKLMSTVMLRNTDKSNLQYNLNKSKRRIGAFGIKTWISSY